jgi:hypothetical protein
MNTRFRILRKLLSYPGLLPDERDSCSKKIAGQDLSLPWLLKHLYYTQNPVAEGRTDGANLRYGLFSTFVILSWPPHFNEPARRARMALIRN